MKTGKAILKEDFTSVKIGTTCDSIAKDLDSLEQLIAEYPRAIDEANKGLYNDEFSEVIKRVYTMQKMMEEIQEIIKDDRTEVRQKTLAWGKDFKDRCKERCINFIGKL